MVRVLLVWFWCFSTPSWTLFGGCVEGSEGGLVWLVAHHSCSVFRMFVGGGQLVLKHYKSWGKLWEFGRCVVVILRRAFFHSLSTLYQLAHHTLKKNGSNWAWQPNVWRQRQFVMILTVPKFPKYPSLTHVSFCKQNTPIHPPTQQTQNLYHQIHTVLFWNYILTFSKILKNNYQGSLCRYPCIWFQGLYSKARMSSCGCWLRFWAPLWGSTWMYSPGSTRYGYCMSGKVWYG